MVYTVIIIVMLIVAVLLGLVILIQNPKGGGLSSSFGGGGTQQLGGVKKTSDFLDKSTWALATLLIALILLSNVAIGGSGTTNESKALDQDATTSQPLPAATTPAATPANEASNDSAQ